jgi:hypothetical protein
VLNGVGSCLPGLQDRGALELTGHEGIVPIPVISGPQSVTAGSITMFTATAASTPTATFSWQSSDGASGSGASFQHAFQQAGSYTLTLRAAGAPGCTATATHTITVKAQPVPQQPATSQPAKEQAPPASPPANPPVPQFALLCANRRLTLTDVVMRGGRVLLTGAAEGRLVGKLVQIFFDGHQRVAVARVHPDGSFSAQAPMPPVGLRFSNRARYAAVADGLRSLNLKLTRRLVLDPPVAKGARVLLSGEVLQPLTRPRSEILVYREGSNCTHRVLVARVRPEANGHYRLMLRAPAGRAATVYRLSSRVRANTHSSRTFQTFSLTESVRLH